MMLGISRALALAALLLAPSAAAAAELYPASWTPILVNAWGGLNVLNDSTVIGTDAQTAQNVLTDNGYVETRPGNTILATILAGYPAKYADDWVSPNGTRYLIAHASDTVYQTNFSGAPIALSTVAPNYNLSSISAFSRRYFADGQRAPWYWNGTSTATVADTASGVAAPICTYMAYKDSRVFCANIPNDGTSRVRISSTGGAGYWVVPADVSSVDNAPNVFDFTPDDGDSIKCLASTPWGVFVGKGFSSWMIKGTGNLSYELRMLDPKIGCVDNRSVQMVDGVLKWLSRDGVYGINGTGKPQVLSRELDPLIRSLSINSAFAREWRVDTQADWSAGNLTASGPGATISVNAIPGSISPSTFSLIATSSSDFVDGTLVNLTTETVTGSLVLSSHTFRDDWASGSYSAGQTTWTVTAGGFALGVFGGIQSAANTGNLIHSTQVNISTGHWQFSWKYTENTAPVETCADTVGVVCLGMRFVKKTNGDYYAVEVSPSGGSGGHQVSIVKSVGGVRTHLSDATKNITDDQIIAFVVERTTDGRTFLTADGVMVASTTDTGVSGAGANYTEILLTGTEPGKVWTNFLKGFYAYQYPPTGRFTTRIFDTAVSTPTWGALSSTFTSRNDLNEGNVAFYLQTSAVGNGSGFSALVSSSDTVRPTSSLLQNRYVRLVADFQTFVATKTPQMDAVSIAAASTGYYYSPVQFVGSAITSYGNFTVSQTQSGGASNTWSIRATTYSFTDASGVNIPWISQTANQSFNVAVATPAYVEFRDYLDFTTADSLPSVSRVQTNWNEGSSQPVSSGAMDRRYFLCVAVSTSVTIPDTCFIHQKNGKWVTWTGPLVSAMGQYNNNLVVADGATSSPTSKVWKIMQDGIYNDDGAAIDSQWVTADYTNGATFNDKVLHEFWVDATPVVASSVTLSYQVNKSSGFTDYQFPLDNGNPVNWSARPLGLVEHGSLNQWVPLALGYDVGKYVRIKFSNSTLNQYWRINSYLLYLENKGRQVPN